MDAEVDFKLRQCLGKKQFETFEIATAAASLSVKCPMRVYQCKLCCHFHLASKNEKPRIGWHAPCGGEVRVIYRAGIRYCGKCLKKMLELK